MAQWVNTSSAQHLWWSSTMMTSATPSFFQCFILSLRHHPDKMCNVCRPWLSLILLTSFLFLTQLLFWSPRIWKSRLKKPTKHGVSASPMDWLSMVTLRTTFSMTFIARTWRSNHWALVYVFYKFEQFNLWNYFFRHSEVEGPPVISRSDMRRCHVVFSFSHLHWLTHCAETSSNVVYISRQYLTPCGKLSIDIFHIVFTTIHSNHHRGTQLQALQKSMMFPWLLHSPNIPP